MHNNIKKHCDLKLVKDESGKNKVVKRYYTLKFTKDGIVKNYIDADNNLIKTK